MRYDVLTRIVLGSENFFKFFDYVEMSTFDIASDAFATFKVNFLQMYLSLAGSAAIAQQGFHLVTIALLKFDYISIIIFKNCSDVRYWPNSWSGCNFT